MFCATQSTAELQHVSSCPVTIQAHLSITVYSPQHNQAISNHIAGPQPKRRPGMSHNNKLHHHDHNTPRQSAGQQGKAKTSLAFHATPLPEYEKLSADKRDLSMLLMTSMPRALQIPGIQSIKVMWTGGLEPFMADLDHVDMSMRV
jgi:hypothetical protein